MDYKVLESQDIPGEWRVETINHEGEVCGVVFLGPDAKKRAEAYAAWKSAPPRDKVERLKL